MSTVGPPPTRPHAVRPLTTLDEFRAAVELERLIWGWDDLDILPVRFFVVAKSIGGQILGAFDDTYLCGFLLAIPALDDHHQPYIHSHMLGVLNEYRNFGVGKALKLAQRDDALARGIHRVQWSFDPLQLKNAYFNLETLGAIVQRFEPNLYGFTTSPLQAGLPTDRLIAEWDLAAPRRESAPIASRISIPADIDRIKRTNPSLAGEIQRDVARQLREHLSNGLAITGFERTEETGSYLLSII